MTNEKPLVHPTRGTRRLLAGYARCRAPVLALAVAAGAGLALYSPPLPAQVPSSYIAVEYARLDNPGATTVIRSINSAGEVAGGFQRDRRKGSSALIFLANNNVEEVAGEQGVGNTANSIAYGINDQGEVAGAFNTDVSLRPFRALRKAGLQELALPPGSNGGVAYSINEQGEAAGYVSGASGIRPVWWSRRGDVQLLQSIGNATAKALALNDRGDFVGVSGAGPKGAVAWPRKGGVVSLGTLPGYTHSEAVSVSQNGAIVGVATGASGFPNRTRAMLWRSAGAAVQDLGTLPGGSDSRARAVNNRGEVVGTSTNTDGVRAFIWTAATGMLDLNKLVTVPGLVMTDALGINKKGDILVMGHDGQAQAQAHGSSEEHADHHAARRVFVLRPQQ